MTPECAETGTHDVEIAAVCGWKLNPSRKLQAPQFRRVPVLRYNRHARCNGFPEPDNSHELLQELGLAGKRLETLD